MSSTPINAGQAYYRLGGELITASQSLTSLCAILVKETDADQNTLREAYALYQAIENFRQRITSNPPTTLRQPKQ
jgi:hypothetical protein